MTMEHSKQIIRSSKAFEYRLKMFSVSFIALGLLVIVMVFNLFRSINANEILDILFAGIIFCITYLIFVYVLWYQWQGIKYFLTPQSLIVKQKTKGLFSNYVEEIYTLKSITSAKITQSGYAQKNNYGDITLFLTPGDKQVVLKDIDKPDSLSTNLSRSIGITTMQNQEKVNNL
jgi:hypothetical protein